MQATRLTTYLCGGINGLSDSDCNDWRSVAREFLHTRTLDPMRRDYRGIEGDHVDEIVKGDIMDVIHSHFVLVNATRPSWGTAMEIAYAHQLERKVVAWVAPGPVSPWLRYHSDAICDTLIDAMVTINQWAEEYDSHAVVWKSYHGISYPTQPKIHLPEAA